MDWMIKKITALSFFTVWLSACSVQPSIVDLLPPSEFSKKQLLSGSILIGEPVKINDLPEVDILAINSEMEMFLDEIKGKDDTDRLNNFLLKLQEINFSLFYEANATLNASEVFLEKRGNCMAFSAFMVAMVRELGIEINFNQVFVPETRYLEDQQTYVYQHINTISDLGSKKQVLDFNFIDYESNYHGEVLDDSEAFSKFYSNLSVDFLSERNFKQAFLYIRKALLLSPDSSNLWSNLGAIYRSAGYRNLAISTYRVSLELDSHNMVALNNMERALRERGDLESAQILSKQLQNYREQNPYYWYASAQAAYSKKDYASAIRNIKDAISLEKNDHRFHYLLGLARFKSGSRGYRKNFQEALILSETKYGQTRYKKKFDALGIQNIDPVIRNKEYRHPFSLWDWWYLDT
ncbi:transglutaminase domain-containing protein [Microbulbifer sp. DLAB2-AA]|uniref:transglutaminase domain-containing protein n=1 Tax=Microbulbifer sp. DLAB2-AA TaxID=3243394 RepID=UPI004039019D